MDILLYTVAALFFTLALGVCLAIVLAARELQRRPPRQARGANPSLPRYEPTIGSEAPAANGSPSKVLVSGKRTADGTLRIQRQLTLSEGRFYDFLKETVDGRYLIDIKPPLENVLKRNGWIDHELYSMLKHGHLDFLLLEPSLKRPLLAIELDDATHGIPSRQARDQRKDELLRRANLKLLRFRVGKLWGEEERELIRDALAHGN